MNKRIVSADKFSKIFVSCFYCVVWVCCFALTPKNLYAQQTDPAKPQILINIAQNDGYGGVIEIHQPVQAENLLKMQIANNRLQKGIPGYRIHIFSQSGQTARQNARNARTDFMKNFPETETYEKYDAPNFQIFVGNYRTKSDAWRECKQIAKLFPNAFIVSDIIDIPK